MSNRLKLTDYSVKNTPYEDSRFAPRNSSSDAIRKTVFGWFTSFNCRCVDSAQRCLQNTFRQICPAIEGREVMPFYLLSPLNRLSYITRAFVQWLKLELRASPGSNLKWRVDVTFQRRLVAILRIWLVEGKEKEQSKLVITFLLKSYDSVFSAVESFTPVLSAMRLHSPVRPLRLFTLQFVTGRRHLPTPAVEARF